MQHRRHEKPIPRTNPSGKKMWVARWTNRKGDYKYAGTFAVRGACREPTEVGDCCAQHAIDAAYARESSTPGRRDTLGAYSDSWLDRHPRSDRTNRSYRQRVGYVLDVELEERPLREWPLGELRRRHATDLVKVLLVDQGRAASGAQGVLRVLSALFEDAISDDLAEVNPFAKVKVRASDPRVMKAPRRIRTWTWGEMHAFAAAAALPVEPDRSKVPVELLVAMEARWRARNEWLGVYATPMLRALSECGLRLGELLPLERGDLVLAGRCVLELRGEPCRVEGPHLHVDRTAYEGRVQAGTKTDHGETVAGRAVPVPVPLEAMLRALPPRLDSRLLFPTMGGQLWRERNWYRDVWAPARERTGIGATPHEFRHSWISLLRAEGVDPADLAAMAGHSVETATKKYTHALGRSYDAVREAVGS
jgi:integrase